MVWANLKKLIISIAITIACLFSSCGLFYADDPAPELEIPKIKEIESVYIGVGYHSDGIARTDEEIKQKAIDFLQSAIPTKRESVNDTPNREVYYRFYINGAEKQYLCGGYFYEDKSLFGLVSKWYYEVPYNGIYEVSKECALALLEK